MLPTSIRSQFEALRGRERVLAGFWTLARAVALLAAALAGACLLDWTIDLYRDTPAWLLTATLALQAIGWLAAAALLVRVLLTRHDDEALALRVEEKHPVLRHRLISAVQFAGGGGRTDQARHRGMSLDLIAALTRRAEAECARLRFTEVADGRRLGWGLALLAPVLLVALAVGLLVPATASALVARQFGADVAIPRRVALEPLALAGVWPSGEVGELRFRVTGARPADVGTVTLVPEAGAPFRIDLVSAGDDQEGAVFTASVPPGDAAFTAWARLGDGRARTEAAVRYEARPAVVRGDAWVQLPKVIGLRAGDRPYEEGQKAGDVVYRLAGSRVRLMVTAQKPVAGGEVEILRPGANGEEVRATRKLTPAAALPGAEANPATLEGGFALEPGDTGYRVWVTDANGFRNREPYRRSVRMAPLDPPEVALLPETFGGAGPGAEGGPASLVGEGEDREVEGIPVLLGQRFRVEYRAACRYGLDRANLRYRVVPKGRLVSGAEGGAEGGEFLTLVLGGPKSPDEFRRLPAPDSDTIPGQQAVGRYDCSVAGLADGRGGSFEMKPGDRVQFYVEVFGREPGGQPGRSAVREKEVVELKEYLAWLERKEDLKEKTRQLEERQRGAKGSRD